MYQMFFFIGSSVFLIKFVGSGQSLASVSNQVNSLIPAIQNTSNALIPVVNNLISSSSNPTVNALGNVLLLPIQNFLINPTHYLISGLFVSFVLMPILLLKFRFAIPVFARIFNGRVFSIFSWSGFQAIRRLLRWLL